MLQLVPGLMVVTLLVLAFAGYQVSVNRDQISATQTLATQGRQAHVALCVFDLDLARRIKAGRQFLHEHPNGIPGIDKATLSSSIANQEATLAALSASLTCTPIGGSS